MRDFLLDLRLEFVRRPPELVHVLPDLARDLRQLLGPKDHERQNKQEDRLGKAHASHHTAGTGQAAIAARPAGDNLPLTGDDFPLTQVPLMMLPMQLWFARGSEVSIREQLVTQVVLGILSDDLAPGQRLPSTRELARRFHLHPNTVSAGYRQLEREHWVEFRHGSGVYVREQKPEIADSSEFAL